MAALARPNRLIFRSTSRSSSTPPSELIAPASNAAATERLASGGNEIDSALHSVGTARAPLLI
jgi:hypothetical protein